MCWLPRERWDTILVHPREVFRAAIVAAASAVLLMHNHPSGDPKPSEADRRLTNRIIEASKHVTIQLLDHVIFGSNSPEGYFSFRESGLL